MIRSIQNYCHSPISPHKMWFKIVFAVITLSFTTVTSLPLNTSELYNLSQYREVYDQRQKGKENWQINLDGVQLIYTGPEVLLQMAALLEPGLFDGDQLEELENLLNQEKPQGSSTTTIVPTTGTATTNSESTTVTSPATRKSGHASRRRIRLPGLLRPFLRRQQ